MTFVPITYYSDILCIWAYVAQLRLDEIDARFGDQVRFTNRFCSVFGDTERKVATSWKTPDPYRSFSAHVLHAGEMFPELELSPALWLTVRPASSSSPHLFLKAVELCEREGVCAAGDAERTTREMRRAFFQEGRDIARWETQCEVGKRFDLDIGAITAMVRGGRPFAALASDYHDADAAGVQGSPTFVLNEGRQKLYGNVGYKIIEANINELLRGPQPDQASWC